MSAASQLRLTNADLEAMPGDGNRYEVIDGELFVSGAPEYNHQHIPVRILNAFFLYLRDHPIGEIVPGVGVIFDEYNGVIPDLVFATHETMRQALAGRQRLISDQGSVKELTGCFSITVQPDDVIEIETPGGGGFGDPDVRP